jgi:phage tail-like protein
MANTPTSYLQHLPEILRVPPTPGAEPFLGRFLKIFEALLTGRADAQLPTGEKITGLEEILEQFVDYLDPTFTPVQSTADGSRLDSPFLTYLASWVALILDQNWDLSKKRQWLKRIVPLYQRRGTRAGLGDYLAMFVGNQAKVDEPPGGFLLGKFKTPSGAEVKGSSTVGVDTFVAGAPAYYFRVRINYAFEPEPFDIAVWRNIRKGTRAIIDLEKPAHTYYTLDTRTPGIIVGGKGDVLKGHATVGRDTLIWNNFRPV